MTQKNIFFILNLNFHKGLSQLRIKNQKLFFSIALFVFINSLKLNIYSV
jgi:hypothetical protein